MKSSIANKSMLAVAVLLVAAFAGVAFVGTEDSDAAVSYTVSVDGVDKIPESWVTLFDGYDSITASNLDISNKVLGNDLKIVDGKITGTVVKAKGNTIHNLWGTNESYLFMVTFSGITPNAYINFEPSVKDADAAFQVKSVQTDDKGVASILFKSNSGADALKDFSFVISANDLKGKDLSSAGSDAPNAIKDRFNSYYKEKIEFDIEYIGNPVEIKYTVGDFTYVQNSNIGKTYKLVSLDDLRAVAPEGKKFIGWTDGTDTYPVGTVFVLSEEKKMTFSALFEDIPAVMITFKDGTSTLKVVNVTELSESTIPTVSKVGYNFDGWFHDGAKVDPLTYTFTESVTLEAKWTAINCYVTFVAGADYSKTVPVLYGSTVQAPVVPSGYTGWDFDFAQAITEDVTIEAIAAPAPEPSGFDDPVFLTMVMVGVVIVLALLAAFIYAIKEGKIVIGRGPNSKNGKGGVE